MNSYSAHHLNQHANTPKRQQNIFADTSCRLCCCFYVYLYGVNIGVIRHTIISIKKNKNIYHLCININVDYHK
jgi:hypothetical protein